MVNYGLEEITHILHLDFAENTSTSNLMAKIIQSKAQFYSALCRYIVPTSSEGSEVQAILGGSGLVGVTNSQEMPIGPVGQSLPLVNNILKKEYTYNQGSAANADAQLASLAQTGSTLIAFESSGEYYHPQGDQVRDGRQILGQPAQMNDSQSELQICSRKRLMEQSEGHQLKQARVDG